MSVDVHNPLVLLLLYSFAAHLLQTIPQTGNVWVQWIIESVQYVFANFNKMPRFRPTDEPEKDKELDAKSSIHDPR